MKREIGEEFGISGASVCRLLKAHHRPQNPAVWALELLAASRCDRSNTLFQSCHQRIWCRPASRAG
jgi:hypothetical protein